MAEPDSAVEVEVEVVYALPDRYWSERLRLPAPATVASALAATGLARQVPGLRIDPSHLAVHGRAVKPDSVLQAGDRLEILRPLVSDPKEVRRRRAQRAREASRGRPRGGGRA